MIRGTTNESIIRNIKHRSATNDTFPVSESIETIRNAGAVAEKKETDAPVAGATQPSNQHNGTAE